MKLLNDNRGRMPPPYTAGVVFPWANSSGKDGDVANSGFDDFGLHYA